MDIINNSNYQITLGSGSSRRKELLDMTGIKFDVNSIPVNEDFPNTLKSKEIAEHIVINKSKPFRDIVRDNQIIITADTLVWFQEKCWGKPKDKITCVFISTLWIVCGLKDPDGVVYKFIERDKKGKPKKPSW